MPPAVVVVAWFRLTQLFLPLEVAVVLQPQPAFDGRVAPQLRGYGATTLRSGICTPVTVVTIKSSPTELLWQKCQEVVGLAGVSRVCAWRQRENHVLPSLQGLAQSSGKRKPDHPILPFG